MTEQWKPLEDYVELPTNLEISNLGRIRKEVGVNPLTGDPLYRYRATPRNLCGYPEIKIQHMYNYKIYRVHRLVAAAFVPNYDPEVLVEIDHIDDDKENFKADNLQWVTRGHNQRKSRLGKKMVDIVDKRITPEDRVTIKQLLEQGKSRNVIAKQLGFNWQQVDRVYRGLNEGRVLDNGRILFADGKRTKA